MNSGEYISRGMLLEKIDEELDYLVSLDMLGAEHILTHHGRRLVEDAPAVPVTVAPQEYIYFSNIVDNEFLVNISIPITKEQFEALGNGEDLWEVLNNATD